jgi:sigma-B regulation protein RsbU (phosphoserine phosphatase)
MARRTAYLNQVVDERTVELRRSNDLLLARDAEITQNLRAAGRLQKQLLLPHEAPAREDLKWAMFFKPLDYLGGDYYDFCEPEPGKIGVLVADAAGHSVAAAMVAVMARIGFGEIAHQTAEPGAVLAHMNEKLIGLADERFVSAFYGVLDTSTKTFSYAGAGHPYPLHYVAATTEVKTLTASGFLLGIVPGESYRNKTVPLSPGDKLVFYTDGVVEARNEIGEMYGTDRLTECLRAHGHASSKEILTEILAHQKTFCGTQAWSDDVTILVLSAL